MKWYKGQYITYKDPSSQSYGFPVVIYECESWNIKKAECQRVDAFDLWCWRRVLRVPWTARRSNQSILKEISPEYSLEGLMLKLKLQYLATWCELIHWKRPWYWERLKTGGEGDDRGWDGWMLSLTQWTWVWASSRSWWWTGEAWRSAVHGVRKSPWGQDWATELNWIQRPVTYTCHWLNFVYLDRSNQKLILESTEGSVNIITNNDNQARNWEHINLFY